MKQAIFNRETLKIELHFDKADYIALTDAERAKIKSAFLWSRGGGCWVSRAKEPNLWEAKQIAENLGFDGITKEGERLTFAEQVEREKERAERRADRYDAHADRAAERAAELQRPMNDHHGDIAFFTQPNINSGAGRAFQRYRDRVYASFERGFDEFRRSEYWRNRAETARQTAAGGKYNDASYIERKIKEGKLALKHLRANLDACEKIADKLAAGETVRRGVSGDVWTMDELEEVANEYLERMEAERDKVAYLLDRFDELGGGKFSRENVKPGYIVRVSGWGDPVEVVTVGKCNFNGRTSCGSVIGFQLSAICEIITAEEKAPAAHPFTVGDTFTVPTWDGNRFVDTVYTITKATDKSVTIQSENGGEPFTRKPSQSKFAPERWNLKINDGFRGIVTKYANA